MPQRACQLQEEQQGSKDTQVQVGCNKSRTGKATLTMAIVVLCHMVVVLGGYKARSCDASKLHRLVPTQDNAPPASSLSTDRRAAKFKCLPLPAVPLQEDMPHACGNNPCVALLRPACHAVHPATWAPYTHACLHPSGLCHGPATPSWSMPCPAFR